MMRSLVTKFVPLLVRLNERPNIILQYEAANHRRLWTDKRNNRYYYISGGLLFAGGTVLLGVASVRYLYSNIIKNDQLATHGEVIKKEADCPLVVNEQVTITSEEVFPERAEYILIGAGTASVAAYRAIKSREPLAKILLIGAESVLPYMRPPLSKEMWFSDQIDAENDVRFKQWNGRERSIFFEPSQFYTPYEQLLERKNGGISLIKGHRVVQIDAIKQQVVLDSGQKIMYNKCLIATGGKPKRLSLFTDFEKVGKVSYFRNISDFQKLFSETSKEKCRKITIIGGGLLGSELSCALALRSKCSVTQIYPEQGVLSQILPKYLSSWATKKVASLGVEVIPSNLVTQVSSDAGTEQITLILKDDRVVETDHIVVAVGMEPDVVELAKESGLELDSVNGGLLVNEELQVRSNLWAAGDAISFFDSLLGRRRVEHHDHAVNSGRLAGENMTETDITRPYNYQPMYWSDFGPDIGFEAVGIVNSNLETVGVFAMSDEGSEIRDYGKGVVFYLSEERKIVGVLLWNVFNGLSTARKILKQSTVYDDFSDVARLFDIYSE